MKYISFDTIPSTNLYLKENYKTLDSFTVCHANHQTSGRGRLGRTWIDNDDLLFSILIKEELENVQKLSLLVGYSIMRTLKHYEIDSLIKWPNDIMINDKKICGILLESVYTDKLECLIIGVGLNLETTIFNGELIDKASSIRLETNKEINKEELLINITNNIIEDYNIYKNESCFFLDYISNHSFLTNKCVLFNYNEKDYEGKVIGIDKEGNIMIECDGDLLVISSGEVSLTNNYKS